jgi:hypothetical protein
MGLTDEQVQAIAQRGANGWLSRQPLDPGAQHARSEHIAALIQDRRELRSAIKAALTE